MFTRERCRKILKEMVEETGLLRHKTDQQRENLKIQLGEIERRTATREDRFDSHPKDADVVLPRLRELKTKQRELSGTLSKFIPLRSPPPHLYTDATLERFQSTLREVFLSARTSMTKSYLRFLVERIEVSARSAEGTAIDIVGKSGAAIALMASPRCEAAAPVNLQGPVLGSVRGWLQREDSITSGPRTPSASSSKLQVSQIRRPTIAGTGLVTPVLAAAAGEVVATDYAVAMVERLRNKTMSPISSVRPGRGSRKGASGRSP